MAMSGQGAGTAHRVRAADINARALLRIAHSAMTVAARSKVSASMTIVICCGEFVAATSKLNS